MFSMCSELTPRARIQDTRIPQLVQPWQGGWVQLGVVSPVPPEFHVSFFWPHVRSLCCLVSLSASKLRTPARTPWYCQPMTIQTGSRGNNWIMMRGKGALISRPWFKSDYCSSQPSMVHWLSSSIFPCWLVGCSFVPLWWHSSKSHF